VEDQKDYPNYHQSDYPKKTDLQEDSQEEDFLEVEDSLEEEYQEEVEDTPEEEEAHQEQDHQEEAGDPHQSKYLNHKQENWWEKHPQSTMETGRTHNSSSINGSCIGE